MTRSDRRHLTDEVVAGLELAPRGRYRVRDTRVAGFWIHIGAREKVFVASTTARGKVLRRTLGRWPALTVDAARSMARDHITAAQNGRVREIKDAITLRSAWPRHRADLELRGRARRTIEFYEWAWTCAADILDVPLAKMAQEPDLFARVFERLSVKCDGRGGPILANRVLMAVRATYRFAQRRLDRSLPADSPTTAIARHPEQRRDTAFDRWTLPEWWGALRQLKNPVRWVFHEFVLLTGARPSSAKVLRWRDVDLERRVLRFEFTKTRRPYAVPISPAIADALERAREAGALLHPAHADEWVFPGKRGHLIEHREPRLPRDAGTLRQTYASCAAGLGVPELLIAALLGHSLRATMTQGYITREALLDPLRQAQDRVSVELLAWGGAGASGSV